MVRMWIPSELHYHSLLRMCNPSELHYHSWWGCAFPVSYIIIHSEDVHSQWVRLSFWWGCAFPVSYIIIHGEDMHSEWVTLSFMVRMCIPNGLHYHSWWGCAFPVSHVDILVDTGWIYFEEWTFLNQAKKCWSRAQKEYIPKYSKGHILA